MNDMGDSASDSPSWTVVQFLDDGTVEAVPTCWIIQRENMCHWPSYSPPKIVASIRKCEPLNTCWPSHKVKIFRNGTFDNYMTARKKAKLAEDTSDINTTCDESSGHPKRKRIRKVLSSSDDNSSDEELLIPTPPKLKIPLRLNKPTETSKRLTTDVTTTIDERQKRMEERVGMERENDVLQDAPLKEIPLRLNYSETPKHLNTDVTVDCNSCKEKDKNLKILIQQNHVLRGLLTDTLSEIREVKLILQKNANGMQKENETDSFFNIPGINFPISNDEDWDAFENALMREEEFQKGVRELSKLGGSSVYDLVKRIFSLTLSNEQTLKFSWLGRKGKKPFQNVNFAKLVIKAAEQAGLSNSQKETEVVIQTWIRMASDRRTALLKKF